MQGKGRANCLLKNQKTLLKDSDMDARLRSRVLLAERLGLYTDHLSRHEGEVSMDFFTAFIKELQD